MTALMERPAGMPQWGSMPGWGIVGDLTPPELIAARKLHTLRRLIVGGLGLVVVLCAVAYAYAMIQHSHANDDLDAASAQTTQLQVEGNKYSGITRIETTIDAVKGQVASVMVGDVDTAALVTKLREALPGTMSIQNMTIAVNSAPGGTPTTPSTSLDVSGHALIGNVTITGSSQRLSDVSAYVDDLGRIPGVTNIVPTSNQVGNTSSQFNISLAVTDVLLSHTFDATAKGGK
jgi:hypothetical protein